jgi:hypothetical protein
MVALGAEVHAIKTPPASELDTLFGRNRVPMLDLMRYAKWGVEGIITDSVTGQPITKGILEPVTPARWISYNDSPNGDYHRFLRPGTYSIKFSANGYTSKTISSIVVPTDSSVVVNVQLAPNPTQRTYAYKYVACNVTDPTQAYANHSLSFWAMGLRDSRRLSIGVAGWVDVDMGTPIVNRTGNDFVVVEGDGDAERCTVLVSNTWNGPWTRLGLANGTTEFDLATGGMSQARYVRLRDDGDGTGSSPTAGFDLDAVEGYPLLGVEEQPGVSVRSCQTPTLSISPNPARSVVDFQIGCADDEELNLVVFNSVGQEVGRFRLKASAPSAVVKWNCGTMPAGAYFVRLEQGGSSVVEKLLLLK